MYKKGFYWVKLDFEGTAEISSPHWEPVFYEGDEYDGGNTGWGLCGQDSMRSANDFLEIKPMVLPKVVKVSPNVIYQDGIEIEELAKARNTLANMRGMLPPKDAHSFVSVKTTEFNSRKFFCGACPTCQSLYQFDYSTLEMKVFPSNGLSKEGE